VIAVERSRKVRKGGIAQPLNHSQTPSPKRPPPITQRKTAAGLKERNRPCTGRKILI